MSAQPTEQAPTRDAVLQAAIRVMARDGVVPAPLSDVAQELCCPLAAVSAHFDSPEHLSREVVAYTFEQAGDAIIAEVAGARDGADALDRLISGYVGYFHPRLDAFRLVTMTRQVLGDAAFGISDEFWRQRVIPAVNVPLDRVEELLERDRGATELPGGIHPRRLAFTGLMMALGILVMRSATDRSGRPLKHTDDELVRESSRALGGAISSLRQLSALNQASSELSATRSEAELRAALPRLLREALELHEPAFLVLDGAGASTGSTAGTTDGLPELATRALSAGATRTAETTADGSTALHVAAVVRCEGEPAGVIHGQLRGREGGQAADERDLSRVETFASMVGIALANVRLYEGLQAQVEARTRKLEQAQAALVQSEKMAALGDLVAGIAHEINTPIGSVLGSQQTLASAIAKLRAGLDDGDAGAGAALQRPLRAAELSIDNIALAAGRVSDIVKQLRRFARLDAAERDRADVNQLLGDTLAILRHSLPAECRVETELGELPALLCYPGQLNQLFLNVLRNAAEAVGGAGRIHVRTRVGEPGRIEVRIADDGPGIAADVLPRVFDPGFTTKGVGVGTGLGLSICYQIAQDHGGELRIDSEPGHGAAVTLTLPVR